MVNKDLLANIKYKELFLPTLLVAMALNLAAVVDSMFVARFLGPSAAAAIELLEPAFLLVSVIEFLVGFGGQILALSAKAEFDEEGSNRYFTLSVLFTAVLSAALAVALYLGRDFMVESGIIHVTESALPFVMQYTSVCFLVIPAASVLGLICEFMRIDGQPRFSSALMILANGINIVLDYVFLANFHMGIAGPAIATLIGYLIALVISLKYHFDPKRTFRYVVSKLHIKQSLKDIFEICKIGFPDASITVYEIIVFEIFNTIIAVNMGDNGLAIYNVCVNDILLVVSIVIMGLAETFSALVPVYYNQHDYKNIKYLYNKTIRYALIFTVIFTAALLVVPDLFLYVNNFHNLPAAPQFRFDIRIFAATCIPSVFATMYLIYYETIERPGFSSILSFICMLGGPLVGAAVFYPILGFDSVFISFAVGNVLTVVFAIIGVKVIERREHKYKGMLLLEEDLIPLTENFNLYSKNDESEVINHLKSLDVDEARCGDMESILNGIFDNNTEDIVVEVVIINHDDNVHIDIKDNGKSDFFENIKKEVSNPDALKFIEVLGFNNMEYVIDK